MSVSPEVPNTGQIAAAISNDVVRVLHAQTGRGPTHARTTISGDLVICVLADTLTVGERTLVASGQAQSVLDTRSLYQKAMRPELTAAVEILTHRMRAFARHPGWWAHFLTSFSRRCQRREDQARLPLSLWRWPWPLR